MISPAIGVSNADNLLEGMTVNTFLEILDECRGDLDLGRSLHGLNAIWLVGLPLAFSRVNQAAGLDSIADN